MHASNFSADSPWIIVLENALVLYYGWHNHTEAILHALAASCLQSRQFFQAWFENKYLNKKMKESLKNLRIYALHVLNKCYPSMLIQSQKTVTLKCRGSLKKG